jgi:hypothetical protein
MSRKLRRVPSSFNWPLKKIWGGYVNPYYGQAIECPDCEHGHDRTDGRPDANAALFYDQWYGTAPFDPVAYGARPLTIDHPGVQAFARRNIEAAPDYYMSSTEKRARAEFRRGVMEGFPDDEPFHCFPTWEEDAAIAREAERLLDLWRGQWSHHLIQADVDALLEHDRLWNFTRVPRDAGQAVVVAIRMAFHNTNSWLPESNGRHPTADEVNDWSIGGMSHDSINSMYCIKARCEREGVPYLCARCKGSGKIWPSPEIEQKCEDWQKEDPPTGDGYQLWEDCSEGSPVSPVFASLEELCAWAAEHATTFAHFKATKEEWREMLDGGIVHAREGNNIFL